MLSVSPGQAGLPPACAILHYGCDDQSCGAHAYCIHRLVQFSREGCEPCLLTQTVSIVMIIITTTISKAEKIRIGKAACWELG